MRRALLHIAFWMAYLFQDILLMFFLNTTRLQTNTAGNLLLSLQNCLVLLLPKLLFTYYILYGPLNTITRNGFTRKSLVSVLLAVLGAILLYRALAVFFIESFIYNWHRPESSFFFPLAFPVALMDIGFVSGAAITLKQIRQQLSRAKVEQLLVKEKLEAELKFLRNQTNPHFLFNTLNNIYSLARKKSDETPDAVMKLSKLLRFMLYDTAKPLIAIGDEVKMLQDYVDLEKMRYRNKLTVNFVTAIRDEHALIAPLLLLPFLENAFKYGASESRFASFIEVKITLADGMLTLYVENNKESTHQASAGSQIGLANVKRQLELLYKEYDLQLSDHAAVFIVSLTINLKSYAENILSHR